MKRILSVSAFFVFYFIIGYNFSVLGEKCKYEENKKDEFTDARIISIYESFGDFSAGYRKVDDNYYFIIKATAIGAHSWVVPDNSPIMLKMGNDSILKLYTKDVYTSEIDYIQGNNITSLKVTYPINKSLLDTINKHWIKKMRLYLKDSYIEEKLRDKHQYIDMQKLSRCIIKDINLGEKKINIPDEEPPFKVEKKRPALW